MVKNKKLKKLTEKEVKHIAKLANLSLSSEELRRFQNQLSETLEYIRILERVRTEKVEPTNQVNRLSNVVRDDEVFPSLSCKEALQNAKETYNGFIKIKAIFNEES